MNVPNLLFPKVYCYKAVVSKIELIQSYKFPKLQFSQLAFALYGRNCAVCVLGGCVVW